MPTNPRKMQGSNAEVAEGGLNPENSFAELDGATDHRMGREARTQAGIVSKVKHQLGTAPGGEGATFGRSEYDDA